ncbi:hypothetical protein [Robertkochia solimangrovi]|uniref:hypothetical protein n=1 Tax=Robertkochia solimangrovi TaxID=2213046 RepID=UPI00117C6078|nr:hypothetical protein [Robertkochia solimangrovi]TRZ45132.1 hypothetical protein DMZ48_05115 [Robertkochia solimangrovi]
MNLKYLVFISLLFVVFGLKAQRLKTEEIIELSEEFLIEAVGQDLFKYFKSTNNISCYTLPANRFGYKKSKLLKKNRRIRKNWTSIIVFWNFNYSGVEGVHSGVWVKLNKQLNLYEPIELDFIPKFVWENRASDFISVQKAIEIGNQHLTRTEFERTDPKLTYDRKRKKYIYRIINIITNTKGSSGREMGTTEILEIDALTGSTYELKYGYHGLIIR